ncbi:pilus assembly protein CpaC [Microvirga sp. KLBC 81]|uniref:type II and III secretion system protein family protein n=1 Tax=Microvirga sp. KLBC 81 TaxID=1862707 RepID=UPI000D509120|nr:type II and III secretion system protein family protein [Microvirga sp. KLBC 81]PVE25661.1 pilus assembly protein CpaC [Microvirga sp. KLBC 81]
MAAKHKPRLAAAIVLALSASVITGSSLLIPAPSYAQGRPETVSGGANLIRKRVPINKSQTVRIEQPFTDVLVGATEIADVIPLSDQTLYILGKKVGTTNVSILNERKQVVAVVDVEVGPDTASVAEKVYAGGGAGGIRVRGSGDQVILEGTAADSQAVDRAVEIARSVSPGGVINATKVASPQQVMLKVRFIEVNRSAGRDLGIRSDYLGRRNDAFIGRGGRDEEGNLLSTLIGGTQPFAHVLLRFANNSRMLDLHIDALESKGLVRRLAEPNLVALSGGTATFHAGGKIPIPVASTTQAGVPTITVQFEPFGVRLNFTPTVLSNGLINLELAPEVSDIDPTLAVQTSGISIPGITVRSARTTVELRDGQSFAMAGLLQNITERNVEQLPWLGSLPVLGALFRSTQFQSRETELVVIVTPHLVKPGKPGDLIASPLDTTVPANDADLFITGKLEVEKPVTPSAVSPTQQWIIANGAKLTGPYGHILPQQGDLAPAAFAKVKTANPVPVVRAKN